MDAILKLNAAGLRNINHLKSSSNVLSHTEKNFNVRSRNKSNTIQSYFNNSRQSVRYHSDIRKIDIQI